MNTTDSNDEERLGDRREIFSSESRRSFGSGHGPESAPAERAIKAKPKRGTTPDETTPTANETSLPSNAESTTRVEPPPPEAPMKSEGDAPPPSLDKSIDEGPL